MGLVVGQVVATIEGDSTPFRREITQVRSVGANFASNFTSSLSVISSGMTSLGSTLTKYITLPLTAASGAVFKLGKDFQSEMSKITGLVGVSSSQVDEWGAEILTLAPQLAKAPKELSEALFFVTSAGIKGAEAMDVLEMSGKASAAGLGETKTIADLVTSAMNAYGVENLSAGKATDILTAAVREGKAEASELAASMGQVLPLASSMGVSFDQVAAAQAAMTRTGTSAAESSTQLKSILSGLLKPSKQAEEQLKAMGTSSSEMRKKIKDEGLLSALMDLRAKTNEYGEDAMAKVFPNIRALMGTLDLMGESASTNAEIFDNVKDSTGSLDDAFKAASETVDFKWNAALSSVKVVAIDFFNVIKGALIPVLENIASTLQWVSEKFKALEPYQQKFILIFAGMSAIIGPVLLFIGTAIATVVAVIGGLITIFTTLSTIISTVGLPVLGALAAGCVAVGAILTIIAVNIGILIAAFINLWKNNQEFRENVIAAWTSIKENAVIIFNEIKKTVQHVLKGIQVFWKQHGTTIMNLMKSVWNVIIEVVKSGMAIIKDIIKLICSVIRGDWKSAWDAIKSLLKNVASAIINITKGLWSVIKNLFKAAISILISVVKNWVRNTVNSITSMARSVGNKIKSMANDLKNKFRNLKTAAVNLIRDLVNAVGRKISELKEKGRQAGQNFVNAIKNINFVAAGEKIVSGVIQGIKNKLGALASAASSMASTVRNKLPFSPAKEGPLKDLDKVNFSSSIMKSLGRATDEIKGSFLGDFQLNKATKEINLNTNTPQNTGTTLNNPNFVFHGVENVTDFMEEMQKTLRRYGGTF